MKYTDKNKDNCVKVYKIEKSNIREDVFGVRGVKDGIFVIDGNIASSS